MRGRSLSAASCDIAASHASSTDGENSPGPSRRHQRLANRNGRRKTDRLVTESGSSSCMEDSAFEQEYERVNRAAAQADRNEPRARSARYDRRTNRIVVELRNGATFMFPAELAQGLAGASPRDLSDVQVTPSGAGLRWHSLDADLSLPNLLAGEFGSKRWMAQLGRNGSAEVGKEERSKARSSRRSKA